jgi:hypothetical protein
LADKGYLFWEQGSNAPMLEAINVYVRQKIGDAIAQAAEEAVMANQEHHSLDELGKKMMQIALENRLRE